VVELQKALEIVDIKLPGHEVRELIRKHDTNVKDGRLDMVEFGEVSVFFLLEFGTSLIIAEFVILHAVLFVATIADTMILLHEPLFE